MRTLVLILVFLVGAVRTAAAQDDPMVLQRCIWSCLANSPGASSPQYNLCVEERCVESQQQPASAAPSDWHAGIASDGLHRFATTPAEQGYAFTYFCSPGQSYFVLDSLPNPAGQYRLIIGTIEYLVPFDRVRGALSVNIPPASPFMDGVRRGGDWLTVQTMQRGHVIRFSLRGADTAIGDAIEACFG